MSYLDPYEEEYAEYRTTQVRYNILKRRLYGQMGLDPRDPNRVDDEEIEDMKAALEDCF